MLTLFRRTRVSFEIPCELGRPANGIVGSDAICDIGRQCMPIVLLQNKVDLLKCAPKKAAEIASNREKPQYDVSPP